MASNGVNFLGFKKEELLTAALSGFHTRWVGDNCIIPGFFSWLHRRSISKSLDMTFSGADGGGLVKGGGNLK